MKTTRDLVQKTDQPLYDWLIEALYLQTLPLPILCKSTNRIIIPVNKKIRKYMIYDIIVNRDDIFVEDSPLAIALYRAIKEL